MRPDAPARPVVTVTPEALRAIKARHKHMGEDPSARFYTEAGRAAIDVGQLFEDCAALVAHIDEMERKHATLLDSLRAERDLAQLRLNVDAKRLADEVQLLISTKVIDARSPVADALLDFREPPSSRRSDRMVILQDALKRVLTISSRQREALDFAMVAARSGQSESFVKQAHEALDQIDQLTKEVLRDLR